MNKYYVYEWIRLDTNEPFYVGKGSGDRWKDSKRGNNFHFNNIVKSIPVAVSILHNDLEEKESFQYEVWYINEYKNMGFNLVNQTDGGDNPPHGFGENNNNYGNLWSDEQKKLASERVRMSKRYLGANNPRATKIMCVETMERFDCIKDAGGKYNGKASAGSISIALTDKTRMAYGYHWTSITDDFNLKSKEDCFYYLVNCYKEKIESRAVVCLEDKIIFKTLEEFYEFCKIPIRKIRLKYKNREKINHNNKEYIFAKYI